MSRAGCAGRMGGFRQSAKFSSNLQLSLTVDFLEQFRSKVKCWTCSSAYRGGHEGVEAVDMDLFQTYKPLGKVPHSSWSCLFLLLVPSSVSQKQ